MRLARRDLASPRLDAVRNPPERWLLRRVELGGASLDCRLRGGVVAELGQDLERRDEQVIEAAGGALLPGLVDHHVHVFALAASLDSLDLRGAPDLDGAQDAPPDRWLRVVGAGGELQRGDVDRRWPDVPARVQHRSGVLWTLNSPAVDLVGAGLTADERRTGQIWRADDRLASLLADLGESPVGDVAVVGERFASFGVTALTDATPGLDADFDRAARARASPAPVLDGRRRRGPAEDRPGR